MTIDILTLFPEMFTGPFDYSIVKRAREENLVTINLHNLREWGIGKHRQVDDRPYGGGPGMVMRVDVIARALEDITATHDTDTIKILLDPIGAPFSQTDANRYASQSNLLFVCGHYEGVDERVRSHLVDEIVSLGDFILTGGEIPAMAIIDSVVRLLPGVLEKSHAVEEESFSFVTDAHDQPVLEYPQYTKPREYRGLEVPNVLLSGDHARIQNWRHRQALEVTEKYRPDLL